MRAKLTAGIVVLVCALAGIVGSGQQLPFQPLRGAGGSVTPAFEGWFKNADGTATLLLGYFNRNTGELAIPVGPDNEVQPGGPDQGQPTHFDPLRQWGVYTITVPRDFANRKLRWKLVVNGETASLPVGLIPGYEINPLREAALGNTPPVLKFAPDGSSFQGPPRGIAVSRQAKVGEPLALTVWATDDAKSDTSRSLNAPSPPPVTMTWRKHRGPGSVSFANSRPDVNQETGQAATTATFSEAGEYILRAQANDVTGEGGHGSQCCWTNAHVRVTVAPAASR